MRSRLATVSVPNIRIPGTCSQISFPITVSSSAVCTTPETHSAPPQICRSSCSAAIGSPVTCTFTTVSSGSFVAASVSSERAFPGSAKLAGSIDWSIHAPA